MVLLDGVDRAIQLVEARHTEAVAVRVGVYADLVDDVLRPLGQHLELLVLLPDVVGQVRHERPQVLFVTVKLMEHDPTPYIHYFVAETGGLLEPHDEIVDIWCRVMFEQLHRNDKDLRALVADLPPYIHYFVAETGGLLEPHELQT